MKKKRKKNIQGSSPLTNLMKETREILAKDLMPKITLRYFQTHNNNVVIYILYTYLKKKKEEEAYGKH